LDEFCGDFLSPHPSFEEKGEDVFLKIKAHPSSSKKKIVIEEYSVDIYVNEPPDKGKANKAIIKFLSKSLSIPSTSVKIVSGLKSQTKLIKLKNTNLEYVRKNLV